jgi:cephalosporin hydroxylase
MIKIDLEHGKVVIESPTGETSYDLNTPEAFSVISQAWLRCGWDTKYVYTFTWLGRPIIQLPEDMFRLQELIYTVKPDVIIETGVAHGGGLIFYAGLCKILEKGRVIGVDIEIRPHNRAAIEAHPLYPLITLIEGSSTEPAVIGQVKAQLKPGETVIVMLDSNHKKAHVLAELASYAPIVTKGSYIVVMDGIMEQLVGAPRTQPDWGWNNPKQAALQFVAEDPNFVIEEPEFLFNESLLSSTERVTYWPSSFLKRVR